MLMAGNAFFCSFQFCRDFCLFQCGICGQVTKFRECRTTLNLPRKPQPGKFVENLRLKHFQCHTSAHIVVCPLGDDILFTDASKQDINERKWHIIAVTEAEAEVLGPWSWYFGSIGSLCHFICACAATSVIVCKNIVHATCNIFHRFWVQVSCLNLNWSGTVV